MIGFLVAGLAYNMAGFTPPAGLDLVSDLCITLLQFSICLKLDVKGLLKPEIWGSATAQMLVSTLVICGALLLGQAAFQSPLLDLSWHALAVLGFDCMVAAIAKYPEEVEEFSELGICTAYDMYEQAGAGLARQALRGCVLQE